MPDAPAPAATSLLCDRCGAPLAVGPRARYVTCAHCGARLGVRRSDSAAWTETPRAVTAAMERVRFTLVSLVGRSRAEEPDLDRILLEAEWAVARFWWGRWTRRGAAVAPTVTDATREAFGWLVAGPLAAIVWLVVVWPLGGWDGCATPVVAVLLIAAAACRACWGLRFAEHRAQSYAAAERTYERRRAELEQGTTDA